LSTGPLNINCDNQGAIALAKDNKFHAHTKHIDIHYHFFHEAIEDGKISVKYVPTDSNGADIFTKPLANPNFIDLSNYWDFDQLFVHDQTCHIVLVIATRKWTLVPLSVT
jgi:hypothetical protein